MIRAVLFSVCLLLASIGSPHAMDTATANAIKDSARAQERQADSLQRLERIERDRARAEDTARHNAERDSRSMRRFDHR